MHGTIESIRKKRRDDEGFTLIELLVVVVIIGVLVAIAVPVYLNYRKGAADKSAQSDVRGAISAVEQYYTENGNTYPASQSADNAATSPVPCIVLGLTTTTAANCVAPSSSGTNSIQVITLSDKTQLGVNVTGNSYTICATNAGGSGKWYSYKSASGGAVKQAAAGSSVTSC